MSLEISDKQGWNTQPLPLLLTKIIIDLLLTGSLPSMVLFKMGNETPGLTKTTSVTFDDSARKTTKD